MQDRAVVASCAVVLLVAALACKTKTNKTEGAAEEAPAAGDSPAAPKEKPIAISAPDLLKEYKANEVRADGKFKGKRLRVVGAIADIKKDVLDKIYVTLGSGNEFEFQHVQAFFDDEFAGKASQLNKGQVIAVECECEGLMMNVLMKHCSFIEVPKDAPSAAAATGAPAAPGAAPGKRPHGKPRH